MVVAVSGEACWVMLCTASALLVVGEHSHDPQIISEQKWKGCSAPLRGQIQLVQKRSSGATWTFSSGLSGSRAARGHVRAVPAVEDVSTARIATAQASRKFVILTSF